MIDGQTALRKVLRARQAAACGPASRPVPVPVLENPDAALRITWYPFGIRLNRPGPKSGLKKGLFMSMLEEYVRDLAELVNRDCGTTNCAGVTSAAEVMKRHFESIGWEAELVDLGPTAGRGLICRNKPGSTECDVIFNAHLDTVFPDGTAAARPFSIEGTTAHGPGCSSRRPRAPERLVRLQSRRRARLPRLQGMAPRALHAREGRARL